MRGRKRKTLESRMSSFFIRLIAGVASFLPLGCLSFLGKRGGDLLYFAWRERRKIALDNLRLAFGREKNEKEIRALARKSFQNLFLGLCEVMRFFFLPLEHLEKRFTVQGKENLNRALGEGKGVIVFTAHLGCFPLIGRKFAGEGFPFSYIIRLPEDAGLTEYLQQWGQRIKVKLISTKPERRCLSRCLEALRENEIVCLLGDQHSGTGIAANFFGQAVFAATGPTVLSLRTGAKIVPMFIIRQPDHTHQLIIDPPFTLEVTEDRERDIQVNTKKLTEIIESYVRRYPDQWTWIHRRWK